MLLLYFSCALMNMTYMRIANNLIFLYAGLTFLLLAFIVRWFDTGLPSYSFWVLIGIAVCLKTIFLINVFRQKGFKPALWLYFILAGVALIFASMFFKYIYPVSVLRLLLFWGAIGLKVTGLILMFARKK